MKILTAWALICVIMALTAALPEASKEDDQTAKTKLVKRWFWNKKKSCSDGWKLIEGRCFKYVPVARRWAQAEKYCNGMKANLASVHSLEEYHQIQKLIMSATGKDQRTWIGGSNAQEKETWLWSDATPFSFVNWCPGEPSNYRNVERCLEINYSSQRCWNDYGCYQSLPFVCGTKP